MKIVWSYYDWTKENRSELQTNFGDVVTLIASVCSAKKYASGWKRVMNCCPNIRRFLDTHGLSGFWDEVNEVNFDYELRVKYSATFFAYPKIWSYIHMDEPSWIIDTDTVFTDDTPFTNTLSDCIKVNYYFPIADPYSNQRFDEIKEWEEQLKNIKPFFGNLIPENLAIQGGAVYFPNKEIAKVVGYVVFGAFKDLKDKDILKGVSWRIYEESLIAGILSTLGRINTVVDYGKFFKRGISHCYVRANGVGEKGYLVEEDWKMCKAVVGVDILQQFPWIEKEYGIKIKTNSLV